MKPSWLPPELTFSGNEVRNDYNKLYAVYEQDFLVGKPIYIDGSQVVVNTKIDPHSDGSQYTYGFTHLVTKGANDRSIDYDRAVKLPWIRPVLEHYNEPEVNAFWAKHTKGNTLYVWIPDYDFIVILRTLKSAVEQRTGESTMIVTAYHVYPSSKRRFQKLYGRSNKIL